MDLNMLRWILASSKQNKSTYLNWSDGSGNSEASKTDLADGYRARSAGWYQI